jgi:cellulose synthase/poly-beta-1,6-N-acetylglucosamine synthase-like glycosyltransferase
MSFGDIVREALVVFAWLGLAYFIVFGVINLAFVYIAWRRLVGFRRARSYTALDDTFASPFTPGISVLVPAYNEEAGIVSSVRSLLDLRYPRHEVIVVNDGSTDGMLERLRAAFDLVPVRQAVRTQLETKTVKAAYVSRHHQNLCVLDKENGGKSDALNAGVNAARYRYVCAIDADAVLEEDALLRVVRPVVDDPERIVAAGGIVRIANGCRIEHGRVVDIALPRPLLAAIQVLEYFRAFLIGRIGWSAANALLIVSGAFGLFDRALVEEVGGYSRDTVGEDFELVVRLHEHLRARGRAYAIAFVPDPVCWTEVPESRRVLSRQRRRWHRGLGETLWRHRRLIGNPRYGVLGVGALPYFVLFELLGPVVELLGPPLVIAWFLLGVLSVPFFLGFLLVAFLLGIFVSVAALALEELAFRRHARNRDLARLLALAVIENVGYRQLLAFWRCRALVDLARGRGGWGEMERRGLGVASG